MHSLLLTDSSTLLVGGLQNHILEIDLNTVQETQKVQAGPEVIGGSISWKCLWCVRPFCSFGLWEESCSLVSPASLHSMQLRHLESLSWDRRIASSSVATHLAGWLTTFHFSSHHGACFTRYVIGLCLFLISGTVVGGWEEWIEFLLSHVILWDYLSAWCFLL